MRIGICLGETRFQSRQEWITALRRNGFNALDYIGENLGKLSANEESAYCKGLVNDLKAADIIISQTHAPFNYCWEEEGFLGETNLKEAKQAIERTARLGVPYCVMHPLSPKGWDFFVNGHPYDYSKLIDHNKEVNLEFFSKLTPLLKETGVKVCLENLFAYDVLLQRHVLSVCGDPSEANYYIDNLGDDCFGCCYDSGHLNHFGADEGEYIRALGKRLKVVHLNDSWGKEFTGMDWHLMPGQGDVNWEKVASALKEIGYDGTASFEVGPRGGIFFEPQLRYIGEVANLIFNK